MLLFKKKYLDAIGAGTKTQTIRLWKHCRMRSGQRSYIPWAGYIRVTTVDRVKIKDLTDDDAVLDGFESVELLRAELRTMYTAELTAGYQAYRVRFEVLSPEEQAEARAEKVKRKQKLSK
jgi:hypothetical protein